MGIFQELNEKKTFMNKALSTAMPELKAFSNSQKQFQINHADMIKGLLTQLQSWAENLNWLFCF